MPRVMLALVVGGLTVVPLDAQAPSSGIAGRAIVAGVVVDASTGRGVSQALVRATVGGDERRGFSSPSGVFYFAGLPAGDVNLTAERPGYLTGAAGKLRPAGDALPLRLRADQLHPAVRIEMFRPAVIGGYVVDEAGEPLPGLTVRALRRDFADGVLQIATPATAVTDDQGGFREPHRPGPKKDDERGPESRHQGPRARA